MTVISRKLCHSRTANVSHTAVWSRGKIERNWRIAEAEVFPEMDLKLKALYREDANYFSMISVDKIAQPDFVSSEIKGG